jgi:hypothetical protein
MLLSILIANPYPGKDYPKMAFKILNVRIQYILFNTYAILG